MNGIQEFIIVAIGIIFVMLSACAPNQREASQIGLDESTRARAVSVLRNGLEDDDFWPSLHAAEGLTLIGFGHEVRQVLEPKLIEETDDRRRSGLARELARAGDRSKVEVLGALLKKSDPYAHVHAAEGLYKIGEVGDREAMVRASYSTDNVVLSLMAAGALARQGDAEALEAIRTSYTAGGQDAIRIGAWLLGRIGTKSDIPILRTRLEDASDDLTRAYIHHALAALGDGPGLAELARNLDASDPAIRTYAAAFAQDAGAVSLSRRLIEMLDDPHLDARYRAAQTLLVLDNQTRDSKE